MKRDSIATPMKIALKRARCTNSLERDMGAFSSRPIRFVEPLKRLCAVEPERPPPPVVQNPFITQVL